ncbi:oligopeptide ABC transporter substrate-binding protein [Lentilactobacillus sp. Marseille-Q4993]|uniref:oligopeptide ABC transporter substrate-binding protein n=1 Tax=Lentilactobacillus sp. Marseille-Q4993 TaxID=3039492 RepID=UPI0024BCD2A5|nr:oligopeptide ABC transporter substrate-binding protein [Lentilactobacillus sp. Marseille-Q4993]
MSKRKWATAGAVLLSAFALAACGKSGSSDKSAAPESNVKLPSSYSAKGSASGNNSTLKLAEVNDAPFKGITLSVLQDNAEDADVYAPGGAEGLFNTDKNYKIVDGGLANQKLNRKDNTATITINKKAKWSDGKPVIAKDVEYAYEVLANKNTTSQQYSADFNRIKGMEAYHAGKAKTISGITYPDGQNGKVVKIQFSKLSPAMSYAGNSFIWGSVVPYHHIKNISIAKLASSDAVRKNPVFVGPYKLKSQVQGESTTWVPNQYYYGPKPKIKSITIQVVSTSNVTAAFKAKKYDFALGSLAGSQYPDIKKLKSYTIVGSPALSYGYLGFNLGHFDTKTGKNVMDKNAKMGNKNLRKAMAYALDLNSAYKKMYHGMSWQANTLLPPVFKKYWDKSNPGFKYNMKKAKSLLDKAGYKKKGKWRVQPNGKKLTIYFGAMSSNSAREAIYQYSLQQWHKLGLNVKMATGKPMEMNSFYSTIQAPKQNKIDVFSAAWSTSSEPTPTHLYGEDAPFNMGHFVSKKNTELMNNMNNEKAWNTNYRVKQFKAWQKYMNEEAAYIPDDFNYSFTPVNHRVKNYSTSPDDSFMWSKLQLTANSPK